MVLFSFVFLFLSIDSQVNTHIRQHTDRINSLHQAIEYKINNVSYIFSLCNNDADFLAALMDDRNDTSSVNKIQSTLNLVYSSIPYLDSIAVYDKGTNTVITTDGHSNISDFFSGYNYTDYTAEYWYNYKYSISKPRFLPPTNVTTKNDIKLIVPLVYSQLGDNYLNKLIIFNIDFGIILSDEEYRVAADNSTIGVINRLTNQVFSPSYKSQPYPLSDELSTIFNKNNTYSGVHSINGKHSLIVYSSPSRSALSYSCFTSIPYASIFNDALQSTLILFALILISSLCAVILAYIFSKRTYAPIRHLELSLDPDNNNSNNSNNNSYENIQLSISQLQQKAESFEIQYENSLSKIQNMYLINLLNTENEHISSDISSYFEFKHDYFCAIIYQIIPKDSFRNEYDYYTYEKLIQNFFTCIYEEYSAVFTTFTLPAEKDIFYILLNLEVPESIDHINKIAETVNNFLTEDKELIDINYSIGGIYEGLSGLKKSHNAALFVIEKHIDTTEFSQPTLNILNHKKKNNHTFDLSKETILTNYLSSFKSKLGRDFIESIIEENTSKNLSQSQLAKMYVQIITTITKVLDAKKIEHCVFENESVFDSISELLAMPLVELHNITFKLMDVFDLHISSRANNLNIVEITNYIDEYYTTDIGLDTLATVFNTSSSYLSRIIKNKLGMNFSEYLTKIRIDRAIELMKTENITVNDLFSEVGFNNRNAFTKAFKRVTGTTPSEYRKNTLK